LLALTPAGSEPVKRGLYAIASHEKALNVDGKGPDIRLSYTDKPTRRMGLIAASSGLNEPLIRFCPRSTSVQASKPAEMLKYFHTRGTPQQPGIAPISMLRDRTNCVAVRSSRNATARVPLSARLDSHNAAMPPAGCKFVEYVVGEVKTVYAAVADVQSWQYSALFGTPVVETYFHDCP
jgi:hypothetical protein